ncbi:cytosine permease [Escherichia coli]
MGGVIIADYLMNRRRYEHFATTRMMSVNWVAILAVALGIAAGHWLPGIVPVERGIRWRAELYQSLTRF